MTNISQFLTFFHIALVYLLLIFLIGSFNVFRVQDLVFCLKWLNWLIIIFWTTSDIFDGKSLYRTLICKKWYDGWVGLYYLITRFKAYRSLKFGHSCIAGMSIIVISHCPSYHACYSYLFFYSIVNKICVFICKISTLVIFVTNDFI